MTEEEVRRYGLALEKTAPPGPALKPRAGGKLEALYRALGRELALFVERTAALIVEADPRRTTELLPEWEQQLGLPNSCTGELLSTGARRAAVVAKLRARGGANPALLVSIAESLGFEGVTITEYSPLRVGPAVAGSYVYGLDWAFVWDLFAAEINPTFFAAGESAAGELLVENQQGVLECILGLSGMAPAHTYPRFFYFMLVSGAYQPWDPAYINPEVGLLKAEGQAATILES